MVRLQRVAAFLVLTFLFSFQSTAATFTDLFVFGDSLSDTQARITNGTMWPEYLTNDLAMAYNPHHNFAVAGATTDDMVTSQFAYWQTNFTVDPDALYVVWGGPNDIFHWYDAGADLNTLKGVIGNAVSNLVTITSTLESLGANHVLLLNLPDLGMTPFLDGNPVTSTAATGLSQTFNNALAGAAARYSPQTEIIDVFAWMQAIKGNPALFGFTDITNSCVADGQTPDCDGYLFYDAVHPTTQAHAFIAGVIENTVAPVPVPAAVWLFVSGLGLLRIGARKRQAA